MFWGGLVLLGLVAPVSATDRLTLPREVEGAPLTLIAERALITAPATLVIPDKMCIRDRSEICQEIARTNAQPLAGDLTTAKIYYVR